MTEVAAQGKIPAIVKTLSCSLQEPRSSPVNANDLGQSAQSSYCCSVSCHSSVEWVSGQEFFFARRQREGDEGPLRNRRLRLRRRAATCGAIKCFRQPRTAAPINRCANPKSRAVRSRGASIANLRGASWSSGCLRDDNADRMNERAICTLPLPRIPRVSPRPKGRSRNTSLYWLRGPGSSGVSYPGIRGQFPGV